MLVSVFTGASSESDEPVVVDRNLDSGLGDDGDVYPLGELLHDVGYGVMDIEIFSAYSMFAAIWALQQIEAGHENPAHLAKDILRRIAISGDFEEEVIETEWDPELKSMFKLPPVTELRGADGTVPLGFTWADLADAGREGTDHEWLRRSPSFVSDRPAHSGE